MRKVIILLCALLFPIILSGIYYDYVYSEKKLKETTQQINEDKPSQGDLSVLASEIYTSGNGNSDTSKMLTAPKPERAAEKPVSNVKLVEYTGPVEHIFFHPLIAYPELAFDGDSESKGYNDWFITVQEFKKIIQSLYEKNFILVDIHSVYSESNKLLLPENKKPLIISVDDMNYYDYMRKNGNVYKLIVDSEGKIAAFSVTPSGEENISYDNEIVPILDSFIEEHSDFSFKGAKGVIALTGYEGILGYRTNKINSTDYESEKQQALSLVNKLKEDGWTFACHGYGHLDANKISYNTLIRDTGRWVNEVEPLTGKTNIYIYPFGSSLHPNDPKFQYLLKSGFNILCSVGPTSYVNKTANYVALDRRHIDGISLHYQPSSLLDLFDSRMIIDKCRPAFTP